MFQFMFISNYLFEALVFYYLIVMMIYSIQCHYDIQLSFQEDHVEHIIKMPLSC